MVRKETRGEICFAMAKRISPRLNRASSQTAPGSGWSAALSPDGLVWMTVAPVPVGALVAAIQAIVLAIFAVVFVEVAAIGEVFVIVPVVVIVMVAIVNADIYVLGLCGADHQGWC